MSALLHDLRKAALIACAAMAVSALWELVTEVLASGNDLGKFIWLTATSFPFAIPLPVLFWLLYRTGITPILSKRLRYFALGSVAIVVLHHVYSGIDRWRSGGYLKIPIPAALAAQGYAAFTFSPARFMISDAVALTSGLAFILFLVALSRQTAVTEDIADERKVGLVRKAALFAAIAAGLDMVLAVGAYRVAAYAIREFGRPGTSLPTVLSLLRELLFIVPALLAPVIVYVSIKPRQQREPIDAARCDASAS